MSSDQIAYLRDLANSYFSEGNLSAAIATWEQVLALDPSSLEARQGITVAQMKMQGVSTESSSAPDPDATMMFGADAAGFGAPAGPFGAPAPGGFDSERTMVFGAGEPAGPAGGFDAERTMVFGAGAPAAPAGPPAGGFDSERTMVFGAGAPTAPPPPSTGGFDPERTMVFGAGAPAPAPPPVAPPPASGGFDAERTMVFNPSLAPPPAAAPSWGAPAAPPAPAAPAPSAGAADWLKPAAPPTPSADSTMLSAPGSSGVEPPPSSAPSPFLPPPPSGGPSLPQLPDFSLPGPPPAMPSPGGLGTGPGLPPPSGSGGGFSFELPPPPSKGGPGLPELPSVGFGTPPPAFVPTPPTPLAPPPAKKAGAQFGEVDAGEIASLSVPTVSPGAAAPAADVPSAQEREEQLKRQYEQQYGRTPVSTPPPPRPVAPSRPAVSPKVLAVLGISLAVVLGGGYLGMRWWLGRAPSSFEPPVREKDPTVGLTPEQVEEQISQKLAEADKAQREGKLEDAERFINEARNIALKNNRSVPQRVMLKGDEIEREQQYHEAFQRAVRSFCVEDYPKANVALLDLERQRPDKPEAGKYIERIFWNLGVEKLQQKEPWEAVYYLESLVQRNPNDAEGRKYLEYAKKFQATDVLGDDYLEQVDPLATRMAGCQ